MTSSRRAVLPPAHLPSPTPGEGTARALVCRSQGSLAVGWGWGGCVAAGPTAPAASLQPELKSVYKGPPEGRAPKQDPGGQRGPVFGPRSCTRPRSRHAENACPGSPRPREQGELPDARGPTRYGDGHSSRTSAPLPWSGPEYATRRQTGQPRSSSPQDSGSPAGQL